MALVLVAAVTAASCLSGGRSLPPSPRAAHLELSVAMGDRDAAQDAARSIERVESMDGLPPEATPRLDGLRARAREVTLAQDLGELTRATARVAAACGECHRAYDGGPVPTATTWTTWSSTSGRRTGCGRVWRFPPATTGMPGRGCSPTTRFP